MPFEDDLLAFLHDAEKILLVGIGNRLRGDDAAGLMVISRLKRRKIRKASLMDCGSVPENCTGEIKRANPTHIVFIDAVEMGKAPGTFVFINEEEMCAGSVSTHKQSLRTVFHILRAGIPSVKIKLVGIQPKTLDFGKRMSRPVDRGVNSLVDILLRILG
ncbi:MAG: hydrogenase 3 maturation endopeptidase HyCI [Candidatus Methanomethylicaceae archaeon]